MNGQVYVIENELGLVKIGISSKPERQIKEIANASGLNITKKYFSKPCDNFAKIEKKLHEEFKAVRKKGEWFNIPFDFAVNQLNDYVTGRYSIDIDCKKNYKSEITKTTKNVKKIPKKYTITKAEADKLIAEGKRFEVKIDPRFKDEYISLIKEGFIKIII